ncbi:hypothetical protein GALMADRAFT_235401 [Galerina marginata CBS 339.88]|uniref:Uncharacterized protein n=1 Tax=Galerina marginata (strain CBS 339.88) TaxID=685588 RepID=A0A067TTT8_GALM3|nr:hypothetical protein GALMADRAFT_235401 [Galerina marginata CBS 339.88]
MATSASAPLGGVSSSSNPTPRWGRSGEPGSAFNGLTRPGRGGRGRGGARGGRGGGRGTASNREPKADDEHRSMPDNPQAAAQPAVAAKPSGSSVSAPVSEKPTAPSSSSSRPKPPSRRASRTIPPAVNTQIQSVEIASAPTSAKPAVRRRRSQASKPNVPLPSKINPPAPNDNLLRPNKARLAPVPHTAPIKDTPPHLNQRFDMRNDIDALVERVRAVAMDNRPTTPGSHIDWAGDDDDSLPDLDDWGVTPATFISSKADVISPLIVGSLKPLPDITTNSFPASPLKQVQEVAATAAEPPVKEKKQDNPLQTKPPTVSLPPRATEPTSAKASNLLTSDFSSRKPLHPSLPVKPAAGPSVSQLKLRAGATPMRNSTYPKSPISATKDSFMPKVNLPEQTALAETSVDGETSDAKVSSVVDENSAHRPDGLTIVEPDAVLEVSSAREATHQSKADNADDDSTLEGLAASIHAPGAIADSVSAPANISSYSDFSSDQQGPTLTHTRAHTVGRPSSFPKPPQTDYVPRFSRSGYSTPRGGFGSYHSRTHSSPPAGSAMGNQHGSHNATRPVITGDAISRLARTIGKTGISTKPQTFGSSGD